MSLQSDLAERDDLIQRLVTKLREQVAENDRLRAELARQVEGASAYDTLVDIHRNHDLPAAIRAKAASAVLPHEKPRLMPERAPLELTAEEVIPLAELVHRRRARQKALEGVPLGDPRYLAWRERDGSGGDDNTAS